MKMFLRVRGGLCRVVSRRWLQASGCELGGPSSFTCLLDRGTIEWSIRAILVAFERIAKEFVWQ